MLRVWNIPGHGDSELMQVDTTFESNGSDGKQVVIEEKVPLNTTNYNFKYLDQRAHLPPKKATKIYGLPKRTFWTLFGVVVTCIVVAAAVGGGIGSALAAKLSNKSQRFVIYYHATFCTRTIQIVDLITAL